MLDVGSSYSEARQALRALCPQPLLNWREARFYGRYGEVELHLLEFLCRRDADAIDIGANDGSYVHYMRRHARHVVAFEPMPTLAKALRQKFPRGVTVEPIALSDQERHDRAAHAGGRRRRGDRLLDGVGQRLGDLSRLPGHRGADGAARRRLFGPLRLHQDRRRGPSAGRPRRRGRDDQALPAAHAGRGRGPAVARRAGAGPRLLRPAGLSRPVRARGPAEADRPVLGRRPCRIRPTCPTSPRR